MTNNKQCPLDTPLIPKTHTPTLPITDMTASLSNPSKPSTFTIKGKKSQGTPPSVDGKDGGGGAVHMSCGTPLIPNVKASGDVFDKRRERIRRCLQVSPSHEYLANLIFSEYKSSTAPALLVRDGLEREYFLPPALAALTGGVPAHWRIICVLAEARNSYRLPKAPRPQSLYEICHDALLSRDFGLACIKKLCRLGVVEKVKPIPPSTSDADCFTWDGVHPATLKYPPAYAINPDYLHERVRWEYPAHEVKRIAENNLTFFYFYNEAPNCTFSKHVQAVVYEGVDNWTPTYFRQYDVSPQPATASDGKTTHSPAARAGAGTSPATAPTPAPAPRRPLMRWSGLTSMRIWQCLIFACRNYWTQSAVYECGLKRLTTK